MIADELREKESELAQQLFSLRLQKVTGQLENPAKIPQTRRDLARVLTVLGEKRRAEKKSAESSAPERSDPERSAPERSDPERSDPESSDPDKPAPEGSDPEETG
jgi:large subunit ribosomal protein L29